MFRIPIRSGNIRISAAYGEKNAEHWKNGHKGLDFLGSTDIYSSCDGTVRVIGWDVNGWGQYITIQPDGENSRHIFAHLLRGSVSVKQGQKVTPNTRIGTMGTSGKSTGVHLHFQVNDGGGVAQDPAAALGIVNKRGAVEFAKPLNAKGCKEIIQGKCKFSHPQEVWDLLDTHKYALELYRKWAASYLDREGAL